MTEYQEKKKKKQHGLRDFCTNHLIYIDMYTPILYPSEHGQTKGIPSPTH